MFAIRPVHVDFSLWCLYQTKKTIFHINWSRSSSSSFDPGFKCVYSFNSLDFF